MERKFYTNDFESLLKENADRFKMYPSKKVWKGIYNDMHPGRKWPSVAMSLFLLCSLVIVGNLNTPHSQKFPVAYLQIQKAESNPGKVNVQKTVPKTIKAKKQPANPITGNYLLHSTSTDESGIAYNEKDAKAGDETDRNSEPGNISSLIASKGTRHNILEISESTLPQNVIVNKDLTSFNGVTNTISSDNIADKRLNSASRITIRNNSRNVKATADNANQNKTTTAKSNSGHENQATNSFNPFRLRSKKLNWAFYFTPSVSYRTMFENSNQSSSYFNINDYVEHSPAPGFEAGTAIKYSLTKKIKFTSGLQLNYSAYNIHANNIHPVIATVVINSSALARPAISNGISFFSNGNGFSPVTLHNYSFQASIPVGFEYILAENNYVQFGAAANLQPSYVITSHSYILSYDKRNYLTQPDLLRSFNMNTSVGLFVTFKSKWVDLQAGPQLRYQLLSTYKYKYPVYEHLINYGVKFSVSKTMK